MITAKDYYYLTYAIIQKDVMRYGPIEASFDVYDDFFSYKSGKSGWIWIIYNFILYSYQNYLISRFVTDHYFLRKQTYFVQINEKTNSETITFKKQTL